MMNGQRSNMVEVGSLTCAFARRSSACHGSVGGGLLPWTVRVSAQPRTASASPVLAMVCEDGTDGARDGPLGHH